jgi:hypothetical protein
MSDLTGILRRQAAIEQKVALAERHGVIEKGKDGKYIVRIGLKPDGTPHFSPWVYPGQHAGIMRQDVPFRVGQNVSLSNPTGDLRQARIIPYAPNEANPRPVHADGKSVTSQIPHINDKNEEEKDKDKPGFQRTESSTERKTALDKISVHRQTKEEISHEVTDKVGSKVRSFLSQKFGMVSRLLDDGQGLTSLLEHEAKRIFSRVGDKVSHEATLTGFVRKVADSVLSHGNGLFSHVIGNVQHLQNPQGFIRMVGSSLMSHGPAQILHSLGGVQQLLSGGGILNQAGGMSSLLASAGQIFTGGNVSHNGINIGGTHTHQIPGPFGMILSMVPQLLGGGGGGSGPPQSPPGTGGGMGPPSSFDLMSASTPFAWATVKPGPSGLVPDGNVYGMTISGDSRNIEVAFTSPAGGTLYRVHPTDEQGQPLKVLNRTANGFLVTAAADISRVGITVFP